ncbi:MAG: hypothetical protein KAV00_10450 [Phycisphaerae bacterium]|nr:hypothetical protein [Phycisphaerae bacterium]
MNKRSRKLKQSGNPADIAVTPPAYDLLSPEGERFVAHGGSRGKPIPPKWNKPQRGGRKFV